ncbi:sugar/nucleoside kinase (ribokinase family) [Arthrobacter sp. UYEF20]
MSTRLPAVTVVGSINLDIIATTDRLPTAGETIGGGVLQQQPGGKGANQAVAAARLGGSARMIGAVGDDAQGRLMVESLSGAGVDTTGVAVLDGGATGTALIVVDRDGENQIVVCPGANSRFSLGAWSSLPRKQCCASSRWVFLWCWKRPGARRASSS